VCIAFFVGFYKLIHTKIVIEIIWYIILGFWFIAHLVAWLFIINKIINQFKGIEQEYLRDSKLSIIGKDPFFKGNLLTTIIGIVLATLMMWLSATGRCY